MALSPEEKQAWLDKHAAASAHLLDVIERWRGRQPFAPLEPERAAAFERDHRAVVKEFEQFQEMPAEVWDEIDREEPM
jgi:hypothetical protein